MRADCMNVHERVEMVRNDWRKCWVCPVCGASVAPEQINVLVPQPYKSSFDQGIVNQLLDYEVCGVLQSGGRIFIEYLRREQK